MRADTKQVIIATLMRPQGASGVQTHCNVVREYLRRQAVPVSLATPLSVSKALIYPLFGPRRLIDRINGSAGLWRYEYWHYRVLRRVLRQQFASGPAVVYTQCPLSARAAPEGRFSPQQQVVMMVHFNVSQADEWVRKVTLKKEGSFYKWIQRREQKSFRCWMASFIRLNLCGANWSSGYQKTASNNYALAHKAKIA